MLINGKLKCVGTTSFIKNKFGIGYYLKFVQTALINLIKQRLTDKKKFLVVLPPRTR